jgi:outer membrane protein OmpA-like peptidoglycan-associated protein
MTLKSPLPVLALMLWAGAATAAETAADRLNFVSCPIVRDTKEVPCWITRYKGQTYYLGIQGDIGAAFYPPQLKHRVLVEGTPHPDKRICGGIVLDPVVASPLPEIDNSCDTILPGGKYRIDFAPRGAGPSKGGVPATDPTRDGRLRTPAAQAEASTQPKTFVVRFDFDNDFMTAKNTAQVSSAARYAALNHAASIEVKGYRASTQLSDGQAFVEKPGIAQARAEKVAAALREIGARSSAIKVGWSGEAVRGDGIADYQNRRVEITVTP